MIYGWQVQALDICWTSKTLTVKCKKCPVALYQPLSL